MRAPLYNQAGKRTGEFDLPALFALPWNADLVHQIATLEAQNRRSGTAHAKGRGEVSGGGRKPWAQKGTGRARHGSIRSPIWKGGGVSHGPKSERDFSRKINRKMAIKALATVLSAKARDHELLVLEELPQELSKTTDAENFFSSLAHEEGLQKFFGKRRMVLFLLPPENASVRRAFRNLPYVDVEEARNTTALDVLNRKYILLPRSSLTIIEKRMSTLHGTR